MRFKLALLLILVLATVVFPVVLVQPLESKTPNVLLKTVERPNISYVLIRPNDPGSGGGGRGEL